MKIYVELPLGAAEEQALAEITPGDEVWRAPPGERSAASRSAFTAAEVVLGSFPEDALEAAKHLRWIQLGAVGVDTLRNIDWSRRAPGVVCTNLRGVFADAMAQTALAGLLALIRGVDQFVRCKTTRDWQKPFLHTRLRTIHAAHVLLLGGGSVTTRLRQLLEPLGCTFTVYARTSGDIHTTAELERALSHADIICAALPDTPDTRNLLNQDRLDRLKPDAIFINLGRGSLVDEPALIAALIAGRIGGAVIDVTRNEPLPPDDPLWNCPRTILTQHTSAGSDHAWLDAITFFGRNLARYRKGLPLQNVVDWTKGY